MDLVFFQIMLEYENEMFLSAVQEDGLTIVAKGLGLENVFTNLLKVANCTSPSRDCMGRNGSLGVIHLHFP